MHGTLPVSLWSPALAVTNAHLEKGKGSFPTFPPFLGRTLVLLRLCANLWFLHFVCKNEILLSAQFVVQAHPHGQEEEGSAGQVSQIQGKESLWDQRGGKKEPLEWLTSDGTLDEHLLRVCQVPCWDQGATCPREHGLSCRIHTRWMWRKSAGSRHNVPAPD